jgi:hypothetical protein
MAADERGNARRWAVVVLVALAPLLLVGAALTVSVYGALFGIPLLVASVPPARRALEVAGRGAGSGDRRLRTWLFALAAILAIGLVGAVAVGADDLDAAPDVAGLVIATAWIGLLAIAAYSLRPRQVAAAHRSTEPGPTPPDEPSVR